MIPDFQDILRPLLELASEGELSISDARDRLATQFELTDEERQEILPSGRQRKFANRVNWSKTYLKKAGLLEYPQRAHFNITPRGKEFLAKYPESFGVKDLKKIDAFANFHRSAPGQNKESTSIDAETGDIKSTPEERIAGAAKAINSELASELLERLQDNSPAFFERMLVQLFIAMGYGGSEEEAGRDLGQSGDGGVDGVIDQDPLGVDQVYIQAKRYAPGNSIGPSSIQAFAGALQMKQASKGIFVTTSHFTDGAKDAASRLGARIVLIDGEALGKLMIRFEIGCRTDAVITLRKIDEDFFDNA